ncbi:hypothetical protein [Asticcacaulis taihuensis]|uniref:Lipoprotein n=1 Tax=Asticcacaulis taihuensis TaxID=260084 RepID=A0A1G4REP3_9CAUL|nr:hypothetical protein [Asticcacaulis taihuensis]SCW55338.1 hypothetical protein SAMN02927928_1853 [Asticcacaulis taihuensis]
MRRIAGLALIALLALSACDKPKPAATPAAQGTSLPASQTAFLAIPRTGSASDDFCTKFKTFDRFENWQGRVQDLRISTLDGTADLEINIGQGIRLEAIVAKNGPVYPSLLKLGLGQAIIVSGQFTHANNDADCLYYRGPFGVHLTGLKS